jgi:hypothetical protein
MTMRSVLALGLLVALSASADAATLHHRLRAHPHVIVPPNRDMNRDGTAPAPPTDAARFAVPGWSDQSTQEWLDRASSGWSVGG